jgi:hypothetical protein
MDRSIPVSSVLRYHGVGGICFGIQPPCIYIMHLLFCLVMFFRPCAACPLHRIRDMYPFQFVKGISVSVCHEGPSSFTDQRFCPFCLFLVEMWLSSLPIDEWFIPVTVASCSGKGNNRFCMPMPAGSFSVNGIFLSGFVGCRGVFPSADALSRFSFVWHLKIITCNYSPHRQQICTKVCHRLVVSKAEPFHRFHRF